VYAILFLLENDREGEIGEVLYNEPNADLEELIPLPERLKFEAAAPGSWWLTITTIGKFASAATGALAIVYLLLSRDGRAKVKRKLEADLEASRVEAEWKIEDIENKRIDAIIKSIAKAEKIKNPEHKTAALEVLQSRLSSLGATYSFANIANRQG